MCIWAQGLKRREGGGTDLTPYGPTVGRMHVVLLWEWAGWPFSRRELEMESGGGDVVAVAVIVPRCLGPGGEKQDASVKSVGFPAQLWAVWSDP